MNILYLCADRGIPIRGHKGAAVHVRAMTDAFARAGHTVTLLAPQAGPADGPTPLADLKIVPLPEDSAATADAAVRDRQTRAYADVLYAAAHEELLHHWYDFVYERYSLWSDVGARLSKDLHVPLVLEVNAPLVIEAAQYRSLSEPEIASQIEAAQFTTASAISVVSDDLAKYVIEHGASPARVRVLPNAVDPLVFHPALSGEAMRAELNLTDRIVVGFVGRPRPWHDLDTLLAAFAPLHASDARYHLLLVGEMPATLPEHLAQHRLTEAVTTTGPVAHDSVPNYIAAMDVAVSPHPALTDFYFSPLKLFEYLACGVPTVATNIGQPAHIINDNETGLLYPPGDADALADCIRKLVAGPLRARKIAWQGAAYVLQHHTWDENARTVTGWFRADSSSANGAASGLPLLDHKLRHYLYRATRTDLAAPLLERYLPDSQLNDAPSSISIKRIDVLKHKPGRRCVLAYELIDRQTPPHHLIGKVFKDERGQRLLRLQQQLWNDGFGPHASDQIHVAQPLAYIPEMRMLVQERAAGSTYYDLVKKSVDRSTLTRRSAEGLAKLHATILSDLSGDQAEESLQPYLLADELASLDRFAAELVEVRPHAIQTVTELRDMLRDWAGGLPQPDRLTPVHRDYYYSQVLFDGPRLTLIDFDLFARGDPAIDVANFIAHLYYLGLDRLGNMEALAAEAGIFVETYARHRSIDDAFLQRVAFYEAATYFRLMNVVSTRPVVAYHFGALAQRTARCVEAA